MRSCCCQPRTAIKRLAAARYGDLGTVQHAEGWFYRGIFKIVSGRLPPAKRDWKSRHIDSWIGSLQLQVKPMPMGRPPGRLIELVRLCVGTEVWIIAGARSGARG